MTKNDTTIEEIITPVEPVVESPPEPIKRGRGRPHKEICTKQ